MQRITHSLKQLWKSERILRKQEMRVGVLKVLIISCAALIALFGLIMLELAGFFALVPRIGRPMAALAVTGINLLLAVILLLRARTLKPPVEIELVKEMRDLAMDDLEEEASMIAADVTALRNDIGRFVHHPGEALLPAVGPVIAAVARGVNSMKSKEKPADAE